MTTLNKVLIVIAAVAVVFFISVGWNDAQPSVSSSDINGDGAVDLVDLSILMSNMDATSTEQITIDPNLPVATTSSTSTSAAVGVSASVK